MRIKTACALFGLLAAADSANAAPSPTDFGTILYGTAYYNEYTPAPIASGRLETDVALMKAGGITVVRMGESSWGKWEPKEGEIDFAWMDRIVAAMNKAGIKVIMGTPTYSIPVWMWAKHPEMLARPMGGGETGYGMRQNMNYDDPAFRRYAERIIVALARHYRDNPAVIGWQLDNETSSYGATNPSVQADFVQWLRTRYRTVAALNDAWLLNYWGQQIDSWDDVPTRDHATSTGYKLDWTRFQQWRAARYIAWQAALVRGVARPDQFLTQNHAGMLGTDPDPVQMDRPLDVVGNDIYFDWQDKDDGASQTLQGDLARSLKHSNWLLAETDAQTQGWDASHQLPPYDGQLYQDAFAQIADGAGMISYWHWGSISGGQETYWGGVLGHDLQPNRVYAEVSRVGADLKRIGPELAGLSRRNQVAILYSVDSSAALGFMPYTHADDGYRHLLEQLHRTLYEMNVGTDVVYAAQADFSAYKLLIVPALYIADDALLKRISDYVKGGGHVIMTFKSGVANESSLYRWSTAPGPLRLAAGFRYQEVSTLQHPLALKGDPFGVGADNRVDTIAELLVPETAQPLAFYDHPFFGRWAAVTRNRFGQGSLLYEGTQLSDGLQSKIVGQELQRLGLTGPDQSLPASVRVKHAIARSGRLLRFYLNYADHPVTIRYEGEPARDLLAGRNLAQGDPLALGAWGVAIAEEALRPR